MFWRALAGACVFVAVACVAPLSAAPVEFGEVRWLHPLPGSLLTRSPVLVYGVLRGRPRYDLTAWWVGPYADSSPRQLSLESYRGRAFRVIVALEPGRNQVVVGSATLELLYRPRPVGESIDGFRRLSTHPAATGSCVPCHDVVAERPVLRKPRHGVCLSCHQVGTGSAQAARGENEHALSVTPDCLRCHLPHASFQVSLLRTAENLCLECHEEHGLSSPHDRLTPQPCTGCHAPHGSPYPGMTRRPLRTLCTYCHRDVAAPRPYPRSVHRPRAEEGCLGCHSPHPSGRRALLREPVPDLCRACHPRGYEQAHEGQLEECRSCHLPHNSPRSGLLAEGVSQVCIRCHFDLPEKASRHPALKKGCLACHGSPHEPRALGESWEVCGSCHGLIDEAFAWTHGRLPMSDVRLCTSCHEPHASDYPHLLRGKVHRPLLRGGCTVCHEARLGKVELRYEGPDNCLRCHGWVTGTSLIEEPGKVHRPVYDRSCTACHNPHYGVRPSNLLEEPLALCLWCHGTLFRDDPGGRASLAHGGDCFACHRTHVSEREYLLRSFERDLCGRCHDVTGGSRAELLHGALADGPCRACHQLHATRRVGLLRASEDALCVACHAAVQAAPGSGEWGQSHPPAATGECSACHRLGHIRREPDDPFLLARGQELCAPCHSAPPDHVSWSWRDKLERVGNRCSACHLSHGGYGPKLLRARPR